MKKLLLVLGIALLTTVACKKDEDPTPLTETPCGNGDNFCFTMDNVNYGGNASLKSLTDRYRVYWEDTGTPYQQVEIDLYISKTGTYKMNETDTLDVVQFEYAKIASPNIISHIVDGEAIVTLYDPNGQGISGTFSGTTETGEVSSGTFYQVK